MSAFPKGGVSKGGDKRGRGINNAPVIVMAAVKNDAITFAKMEVVDDANSASIKSAFVKRVASSQAIRSDGYPAYNIAKEASFPHGKQIIYPKNGASRCDALK